MLQLKSRARALQSRTPVTKLLTTSKDMSMVTPFCEEPAIKKNRIGPHEMCRRFHRCVRMSQRGNLSPWPPHQHHRPGYYESNYEDTRQFHASKEKLPLIAQTHHPLTTKPGDPEKSQVSQKNDATNPHPRASPIVAPTCRARQ